MTYVLEAKNIELITNDRSTPIIHQASFNIMPGEFVIILGHNGSGKSSLVKILSGDRNPTSGEVLIKQKKLSDISYTQKAKEIITISQNPSDGLFLELTLKENIFLWENRFDSIHQLTPKTILDKSYNGKKFENLLNNLVSSLSGGEKQAFLLNLALAHPPAILFLDEHTSALDPKAADEIMKITAKYVAVNKITTIMVTHQLEDALNYGNRLIIMNEGIIIQDIRKPVNLSVNELKEMMEG